MNKGMFGFPTQMAASESRDGFEKLTASSGEWPWPNGVTAATFWIQAPGGGGGENSAGVSGTDGGDSSITYNSVTTTAEGGGGGAREGLTASGNDGVGGDAGGGDLSVPGGNGITGAGGGSFFGRGGFQQNITTAIPAVNGGGGYSVSGQPGGGGEMVRIRVVKVDGLNTVAYVNGTAGTGYQSGAAGFILVEWTAPLKTA